MKALLICPAERPAVAALAEQAPLVNFQVFGKSIIAYWLEYLVNQGVKEVRILAADRPDKVRALVGDGARWGLDVEVSPEYRELTVPEARVKYVSKDAQGWLPAPDNVALMDHFPGLAEMPLFGSYEDFFAALGSWLPIAARSNRVGWREIKPGIWAGLRTRVAESAELKAPCWLGENVWVGPHAIIGPMAVLEDRVVVESAVEVSQSLIGKETFLGSLTEIKKSLALGNLLINWESGSCTHVPDAFLMCALGARQKTPKSSNIFGRAAALLLMMLSAPFASIQMARAKLKRQASLRSFVAVRPQLANNPKSTETMVYYELANCTGWLKYWPQMWNIVRGDFAWVGNRPLSPSEMTELSNDFERLWLAAPTGLISLADAEGITHAFSDETRACASFYAVQANWRLDLSIMARTLLATTKKGMPALF